jgi:hypothetical protein
VHVKPVAADAVKLTTAEKPFTDVIVIVVGQLVPAVHGTVIGPDGSSEKSGLGTVTVIVTF